MLFDPSRNLEAYPTTDLTPVRSKAPARERAAQKLQPHEQSAQYPVFTPHVTSSLADQSIRIESCRKESPVRRKQICFLVLLLVKSTGGHDQLAAQEPALPEFTIPQFDETQADEAHVPAAASDKPLETKPQPIPAQGIEFLQGIALLLVPQEFEDDDGWGDEKKIQSGLNMRFEDGQFRTSRRWKNVNHGSWLKASGILEEPEKTFQILAWRLPDPDNETQRFQIDASARMRVIGTQQQWTMGAMLWSISAEAVASINLNLVVDVKTQIVQNTKGTRVRFVPNVTHAHVHLASFSLRRISHLKGRAVEGVGDLLEQLIRRRINQENNDLTEKVNKALAKKPERLEIPFDIANWFISTPPVAQENPAGNAN